MSLDPLRDFKEIIKHVQAQLIQSDLSASMLAGTGLPRDVGELNNTKIPGPPVLVEVVSMTEIGHSAFNLHNVRPARREKADLAGLAQGDEGEDGEQRQEDGAIQKYPRSMLRFQLSDGATILQAIEYRRSPDLELGETPLGFKVRSLSHILADNLTIPQMLLKNPFVRRGIAFLEPASVELKCGATEERQADADADFERGLLVRMG